MGRQPMGEDCMHKCKQCHKEYEKDDLMGYPVKGDGLLLMGCQSRHDFDIYQFTLVEGWYCVYCLDREIEQGLCQPVFTWKGKSQTPWEFFMPGHTLGENEQGQRNWEGLKRRLGIESGKDGLRWARQYGVHWKKT